MNCTKSLLFFTVQEEWVIVITPLCLCFNVAKATISCEVFLYWNIYYLGAVYRLRRGCSQRNIRCRIADIPTICRFSRNMQMRQEVLVNISYMLFCQEQILVVGFVHIHLWNNSKVTIHNETIHKKILYLLNIPFIHEHNNCYCKIIKFKNNF